MKTVKMSSAATRLPIGAFDALPAREITARRTEHRAAFVLAGGRCQAIQYGEPIHKWDETRRAWTPIDRRTNDPDEFLSFTGAKGERQKIVLSGSVKTKPSFQKTANPVTMAGWRAEIDARLHPEWVLEEYQPGVDLRIVRGKKTAVVTLL